MTRIGVGIFMILCAIQALPGPAAGKEGARPAVRGKISAPVEVKAQVKEGEAEVSVLFAAAAREVDISVRGADGLTVTSPPRPVTARSFARGESTSFHVTYRAGEGRSHLVVAVTGRFDGAKRVSVVSYAVGTPVAGQKRSIGKVQTDSQGKRMKLLPVD